VKGTSPHKLSNAHTASWRGQWFSETEYLRIKGQCLATPPPLKFSTFNPSITALWRVQWFSEMGIAPWEASDPIQRAMWEKPVDAGSISERGKAAAGSPRPRRCCR